MGIPVIGDIINAVKDLASEVIVDKDKKNEINLKLEELQQQTEQRLHEESMGQIEVNKIEAQSEHLFVSGWRPFVGWVGGFGLAYAAIVQPLASWTATVVGGYTGQFPAVDNELLWTVLLGILGLGGMRSFEKIKK